jgi:hypothetical protein
MTKKNLYYLHGFGVTATNPDVFVDIVRAFPGYNALHINLNDRDVNGDLHVSPLSEQTRRAELLASGAGAGDILITHSQGALVAALANLPRLRKIVMLAPPPYASSKKMLERIKNRGGDLLNGVWKFPSVNGATRWVPQDYLHELEQIDALVAYSKLAAHQQVVVIEALDDEVLTTHDMSGVQGAEIVKIRADHNFTDGSRARLISTLQTVL